MKLTDETEGIIRFMMLAAPPSPPKAAMIVDIAIKDAAHIRKFSPSARSAAIRSLAEEWGLTDQIQAATMALLENSTAIERLFA